MGRFASTVAYYESARPPYGAAFFAAVARDLGLQPQPAPARHRRRAGLARDRLRALLQRGRRRRSGAGDGRGRPVGGGARRRRGRIHRRPFRGLGRGPRRVRRRHDRPRNPLARSRSRREWPSIASSSRSAGFSSATPQASTTAATPGLSAFKQIRNRWRTERPEPLIATFFSPAGPLSRAGRSASRRPPRSRRTPRRPHPVDVDLIAGAARRRRPGDEERNARGARVLRDRGRVQEIVEAQAEVFERAGKQ